MVSTLFYKKRPDRLINTSFTAKHFHYVHILLIVRYDVNLQHLSQLAADSRYDEHVTSHELECDDQIWEYVTAHQVT